MDLTCRQKVRSTVDVASDVQVVESNSSDISKADSSKSKGQKHGLMDIFVRIHQSKVQKHIFSSCIGCFGPDFQ